MKHESRDFELCIPFFFDENSKIQPFRMMESKHLVTHGKDTSSPSDY